MPVNAAIPELAARVKPEMLQVLRQVQKAGFIMNTREISPATVNILQQLTSLGLLDVAYEGDIRDRPYLWSSNGNGAGVLGYLTGIRAGPHCEIPSSELAAWLEEQGKEQWWNVDGDPLLTGRMTFPCPAEVLAGELREIDRPLLVQAKREDTGARGQPIGKEKLNEVVGHFAENVHIFGEGEIPRWSGDRLLYLCWKGSSNEWLLAEDSETTKQMQAEEHSQATDATEVKRE
jgi:hypothetical protein